MKMCKDIRLIVVEMLDGSKWGVSLDEGLICRAKNYADEFDGDVERSLQEDTLPLLKEDPDEILDWIVGNMNWDDFKTHYLIEDPPEIDFQDGWMSGEKKIVKY